MGSSSPSTIRTGAFCRSGNSLGTSGTIARRSAAPCNIPGRNGNVGAVRLTDRDELLPIKIVLPRRVLDEVRQLVRPPNEVRLIENPLRKTPKKTWPAILGDLAARTEQPCLRIQLAA